MATFIPSKKTYAFNFKFLFLFFLLATCSGKLLAQAQLPDSAINQAKITAQTGVKPSYPKVVGYLSFIFPLVTVSTSTTHNFNGTTSVGFPIGINVLYSDKFGFSYEITPTIKAGGGTSKTSNILFDPGTMFRFQHGFTMITRLAFETQGRYGFTPVFNQIYLRSKDVNYFVALSTPVRFGNSLAASVGLNLQIGFIFN
jgi:hypothetical protein